MDECKECEGTGTVRAVSPRTGKREEGMPLETCPECGGLPEPEAEPADPEPEAADEPDEDDE